MNKEECLKELQSMVKQTMEFSKRQKALQESIAALNSCDQLWLSERYGEFHKKEVVPHIPKDLPKNNP